MTSKTEVAGRARQKPEAPPDFERRIMLNGSQWTGLIVLLLIPLLAVLGLLGEERKTSAARSGDLHLKMDSPMCARYGNALSLTIEVTSPLGVGGSMTRVEISADYLSRFESMNALPVAAAHTADAVVFEQTVHASGEPMRFLIEITPKHYGWASGQVRVILESGERVELPLKTFIFP